MFIKEKDRYIFDMPHGDNPLVITEHDGDRVRIRKKSIINLHGFDKYDNLDIPTNNPCFLDITVGTNSIRFATQREQFLFWKSPKGQDVLQKFFLKFNKDIRHREDIEYTLIGRDHQEIYLWDQNYVQTQYPEEFVLWQRKQLTKALGSYEKHTKKLKM